MPSCRRLLLQRNRLLYGFFLSLSLVFLLVKLLSSKHDNFSVSTFMSPQVRSNDECDVPIAWIRGKNQHTGYLNHVHEVLKYLGYTVANYTDEEGMVKPWHLLWSHTYPFTELRSLLHQLKPHQKVNHFPGTGFISNKDSLASSQLKSIPKAFCIPKDKEKLLAYAKNNPKKMFVQKSNKHRGIVIKPLDELDLNAEGSFVQEFVHNPLLVDGHKFDIGVYVILTSVEPLRVYYYAGDVLFRFCPEKYHPFDAKIKDKYVVGDDYLPTWKVPSLVPYYSLQGFGMKDSFDAWLKEQNKDPSIVWQAVHEIISEVFYSKEPALIRAGSGYKTLHNFFEMMRFDFIIDEDLRVYLMEANMSPNLSSSHFKQNKLLYRQVVRNVISVATLPVHEQIALKQEANAHPKVAGVDLTEQQQVVVAVKDVVVFPEFCAFNCVKPRDCDAVSCELCYKCASNKLTRELAKAYSEHQNRGMCRRMVPGPIKSPHEPLNSSTLNADNTLMSEWFRGKCILDPSFCN